MSQSPSQSALARVFRQPMLRRVALSWAASKTATWGWATTMNAVLFLQGGVWAVGALVAARLIPGALVTPLFAVVADRLGIMRGLAILAWCRVIATTGTAVVIGCEAPITWLIALAALESLGSQPQDAEQIRVLPWLARSPGELTAANGATELLRVAGILLGPTTCGVLLLVTDPAIVVALFAATQLVGTLPLLGVGDAVAPRPGSGARTILARLAEGGGLVFGGRDTRGLVALMIGASFCMGSLQVLGAGLALDRLDLGASGPALLSALFGLGGLLGGGAITIVARSDLARMTVLTTAGIGAVIALMALAPIHAVIFLGMGLIGVGLVMLLVLTSTLMQRGVPLGDHDAVVGFSTLCSNAAVGLAGVSASAIAAWLGLLPAMLTMGLSLIAMAFASAGRLRRFAERAHARQAEAETLRACPVFAPLPIGPLEQLAASVERLSFEAGATLVRAGDEGEHAYVVAQGQLAVIEQENEIGTLGRGDIVGEIALLEGGTRTATVRCLEGTEVYRLHRDDFRAALHASDETRAEAHRLAQHRRSALRTCH
ncbi:MAG: cyclic nucleotide-binding domain-containing protein [Planctomycetota bacterium]